MPGGIEAAKLFVSVGADTTQADAGLASLSDRLTGFGQQAAMQGAVLSAGLTLPLVGIAQQAISTAADFQSSMNTLSAVAKQPGQSAADLAAQMAQVSARAKELGSDLTLPATSATDAAQAMTELVKGGLSVEQSMTAAKGVLQLSAAAGIDNAHAAEIGANALNAFGNAAGSAKLQAEDMAKVTDLLANAANASSVEITDVALSLKASASVYAQAGIPIENLTAAIAQMGNAGIKGSDAGTSLKTMLMSLQAPSDKAKSMMTDLGISIYDAQGKMLPFPDIIKQFNEAMKDGAPVSAISKKTLEEMGKAAGKAASENETLTGKIKNQTAELAIAEARYNEIVAKQGESSTAARSAALSVDKLRTSIADSQKQLKSNTDTISAFDRAQELSTQKTGQMTQEQRDFLMSTIFGSDAVRAANVIMMQGVDAHEAMIGAVTRTGGAADVANAKMAGLNGAIEGLKSQLETAALNAGEIFLPFLEGVVRGLAEFVSGFEEINPQIVLFVAGFGAVLAAVGPVLTIVGALAAGLGFLISPLGLVTVALGLFAGAWVSNFGGIRDIVAQAIGAIGPIIEAIGPLLQGVAQVAQQAINGDFRGALQGLQNLVSATGAALGPLLQGWVKAFSDWVTGAASGMLSRLGTLISSATGWITQNGPVILATLAAWANSFVAWVAPAIPPMLAALGSLASQVWAWIVQTAPVILAQLTAWGRSFIDWVAPQIPVLLAALGVLLTDLGTWIAAATGQIVATLITWGTAFVEWVAPHVGPMLGALALLLGGLVAWVVSSIPGIVSTLMKWGAEFVAWVAPAIPPLLAALAGLLTQLSGWVTGTALPAVVSALVTWGTAFWEWVGPASLAMLRELGVLMGRFVLWLASDGLPKIQTGLEAWKQAMWQWIVDVGPEVVKNLAGLIVLILDELLKLPARVMEVGKQVGISIVDGMIAGAGGDKQKLTDSLKSIIGSALSMAWEGAKLAVPGLGAISNLFSSKGGGSSDPQEYLKQAAGKRGLDPEQVAKVMMKEGPDGWNAHGKFNTGESFGPLQLHYAGGSDPQRGMGDDFTRDTGIDLRVDKSVEAQQRAIDYALDRLSKTGDFREWYGADPALGSRFTPVKRVDPSLFSNIGRAAGGQMGPDMSVSQINWGQSQGLSAQEAAAVCGPYAAYLFAQATGRNPDAQEAIQLAREVGWTSAGMRGPGSEVALLGQMGLRTVQQQANLGNIGSALGAGGAILSTPNHYFFADQMNAQGQLHVGATGTVMGGGSEWMSLEQIQAIGGGIATLISLAGQMGPAFQVAESAVSQSLTTTAQVGTEQGLILAGSQTDAMGNVMSVYRTTAGDIIRTTTDAQGNVVSQYATMASGVSLEMGNMAEGVTTTQTQLGNDLLTTVTDAAGNYVSTVTDMSGQIISQYAGTAQGVIASTAAQNTGVLTSYNMLGSGVTQSVTDMGTNIITKLTDTAGVSTTTVTDMSGAILSQMTTLKDGTVVQMDDMNVKTTTAFDQMSQTTTTTVTDMAGNIITTTTDMNGQIVAQTVDTRTKVSQEWATTSAGVIQTATDMGLQVVGQSRVMGENLVTATKSSTGEMVSLVTNAAGQVVGQFKTLVEGGKTVATGLDAAVKGLKGYTDGLKGVGNAAAKAADQLAEFNKQAGGGKAKGLEKGSKGDGWGDEKANGGWTMPGVTTLVGENGPELISTTRPMYVTPNHEIDQGAGLVGRIPEGRYAPTAQADREPPQIILNQTFAPGMDPAAIGRATKKALLDAATELQ